MLWASLYFPDLALEALTRAAPQQAPLAVTTNDTRARILAANSAARRLGVHAGMSVPAALALAGQLILRPHQPIAQARLLKDIALWASQFSATLSITAADDAVLLELEAGLKLFNGLAPLLSNIRRGISALGLSVSLAVAPTPSAALMFARSNEELLITDIATLKQRLCALPITSLDCPEPVLETLRDLGMQRIGEVLRLPRDGLAKRFGPGFIDQLDRALGQRPDPQTPFVITEHFSSRLDLPVPVAEVQALLFGAKRLSMTLAGWLTGRGLGVMRVKLELLHEDHPASIIELNLSAPSRDPLHLSTLTRERLERIRLPGRVEALVLSSIETAALSGRNASLFPDLQASEDSALYERLAARLGENAVLMLRPYADHRPERAWRNERTLAADKHYRTPAARPLWLLPSPVPLSEFLHEAHPRLVLADGPERIESGWWEGKDVRRDYFVARARDGQTLWLFRDAASSASWYVHGIFS